jgi:very-short-patch-repair endonuclease
MPTLAAGLLEQALNEGLVRGLVREEDLPGLPRLVAGHHGAKPLRAAVEEMLLGTGITRGEAEPVLRELLRDAGIHGWRANHPVAGFTYDVAFEAARLLVELQSFSFHRTPANQDRDARKAVAAQAAGWSLVPVTARQLARDRVWLAGTIAAAVGRAKAAGRAAPA